jgi:hypothetical protein
MEGFIHDYRGNFWNECSLFNVLFRFAKRSESPFSLLCLMSTEQAMQIEPSACKFWGINAGTVWAAIIFCSHPEVSCQQGWKSVRHLLKD